MRYALFFYDVYYMCIWCFHVTVIYSPATRTQESSCMAFINKYQRSILLSKIADTHQRSHVTIHREHSISYNQPQAAGLHVENRAYIIRNATIFWIFNNYNYLKKGTNICIIEFLPLLWNNCGLQLGFNGTVMVLMPGATQTSFPLNNDPRQ